MRPRSLRWFPLVGCALAAAVTFVGVAAVTPTDAAAPAPPAPTCGLVYVPSSGLACERLPGYFELFGADGRSLGFSHGPDLAPSAAAMAAPPCRTPAGTLDNPLAAQAPCPEHVLRMPHCVDGDPGESYTKVFYLRSFDDGAAFRYPDDTIRLYVRMMDGTVDESGMVNGDHADIRVLCSQGDIAVERIVIGQPLNLVDFSSVVAELQVRGFTAPNVKHLVYFDDARPGQAIGALGQGTLFNDDRLVAANLNNGAFPSYAVSWDSPLQSTLLHELGHNMGAVQLSSPHSSLDFHCYESLDTMCQPGPGPNGTLYGSFPFCTREVWDCGLDDYFNTRPGAAWPASYLRDHWNLGDPLNNFVALRGSTMERMACSADNTVPGVPVACTFLGGNPGATTVTYRIDWGDGTVQAVAARPGVAQVASHGYGTDGTFRIEVSATDDTAPNPSGLVPWDVAVVDLPGGVGDCPDGDGCPIDI